jgi:molybdopterin/thiamine biosynthesis adenylyltransferase
LLREFRVALAQLNGRRVTRVFVVVQTNPAWIGFSFELPMHARAVKFRHHKGFINAVWSRSASTAVKRYLPLRVDSEYLVERNLRDQEKSLLAKRVLLVGCGAIGGHVAHGLARCGAGFGGGSLTLVDPEFLLGGNIGRHRLGFDALLSEKAPALAQDLTRSLPGIDVRTRTGSALDLPLIDFDLIVDATGEEQLSEALNARFVAGKSAPTLFVWINGNGGSVQSFMLANKTQGCLHCWKSHGTRRDFDPSADSPVNVRIGHGCDDPYTPFNGGAALTAAGLAIQAATDWASGVPEPTLRSIQIDYKTTHYIKPKSPRKVPSCPACGPEL